MNFSFPDYYFMIKIYDTMSRDLREFVPIEEGKVRMYVCGPTVYNYIHVGNARSTVAFDTIRRYFEYRGYEVAYISNFTDVDDKIINRAKEEGITPQEVADKYIAAFRKDVTALGVKRATYHPRVVEFMADIIRFVEDLIEKGYAYESQGDVYFRVEKSHNYAKLANKSLEDLELGASGRTDEETARKENPVDFALWKAAKPGEISWDSPWGPGRPGWHIECSVMSTEILGDTIDIHGGGADLEFPHHTNEIAQSEAKTGKTFANYWMHNGFVNIDNVKMSKSLGNFITVHDALKTIDGQVLRFFFATQHYRKPINFTEKAVCDAEANLKYLKNTYEQPFIGTVDVGELQAFKDKFVAAMDEDFNTANGITVVFEMAKWINSGNYNANVKQALAAMLEVFGVDFVEEVLGDGVVEKVINRFKFNLKNHNKEDAEKKKAALLRRNIVLHKTKYGLIWNYTNSINNEINNVIYHIEQAGHCLNEREILTGIPRNQYGRIIEKFLLSHLTNEFPLWTWKSSNRMQPDIQGYYGNNRIFIEIAYTKSNKLDSKFVHSMVNITEKISSEINPVIVLLLFGSEITSSLEESLNNFTILGAELGVTVIPKLIKLLDFDIEALIQKRQEARANRDFATADQIRDQLAAQGIKLLDTKDGVRWTRD